MKGKFSSRQLACSALILLFFSSSSFAVRYYHNNGFRPYVCYKSKSVYRTASYTDIHYSGCYTSYRACYYSGGRHFGKYSSRRATKDAYARCYYSNPRFVD